MAQRPIVSPARAHSLRQARHAPPVASATLSARQRRSQHGSLLSPPEHARTTESSKAATATATSPSWRVGCRLRQYTRLIRWAAAGVRRSTRFGRSRVEARRKTRVVYRPRGLRAKSEAATTSAATALRHHLGSGSHHAPCNLIEPRRIRSHHPCHGITTGVQHRDARRAATERRRQSTRDYCAAG